MINQNTKSAFITYDQEYVILERMFENINSTEDFYKWESESKKSLDKVRVAFYEDSKDVNSLRNCMITDETFLRKIANI